MKGKPRIGLGLLVLLLLLSLATTVFASAEDPGTGEYIPEETTAPTEPVETIPVITEPPETEPGEGFSEDGLTATRDLLFDKNTNKQFITVETKNGKIFYIIIDYDKPLDETGERFQTFFLNQVDETDMKALLEDAGVVLTCSCTERCSAGKVNTACDLCSISLEECVGKVPETIPLPTEPEPTLPREPEEPDAPVNSAQKELIIAIVVVIGAIGIVAFLLITKKGNGKRTDHTDNYAEFDRYEEEDEE